MTGEFDEGSKSYRLAPPIAPKKIPFLERSLPEVIVNDARCVIAVPDPGAMPTAELKSPVANLESERYHIIGALDPVFAGI